MKTDFCQWGMSFAEAAAKASDDRFHQVGCAAFNGDRRIIATGYNGFPASVDEEYLSEKESSTDWKDRNTRLIVSVHAEENCCANFRRGEASTMFITIAPCPKCINILVAHKIKEVFYARPYEREQEKIDRLTKLYEQIITIKHLC